MVAAMQCPVCMIYGREDPWVVPLWGQRLKRLLADAVYLEVKKLHQACHDHACIPTEMKAECKLPFPLATRSGPEDACLCMCFCVQVRDTLWVTLFLAAM